MMGHQEQADKAKDELFKAFIKLREVKGKFPETKMGFASTPGGILNAYRECDLSFEESVDTISALLNSCIISDSALRIDVAGSIGEMIGEYPDAYLTEDHMIGVMDTMWDAQRTEVDRIAEEIATKLEKENNEKRTN